jgi:RimJ/RimL family protein N-acetyltransferase
MEPVRTARFVLRALRPDDAPALAAYRSDAETAHLQSWTAPYPVESAAALIASQSALDGPTDGEWYALGITDPAAGEAADQLLGDVVCHLESSGRTAEIGYTLAPAARGRGAATEAAAALVSHLFEVMGVHRIQAAIHPENFASAMVLERLGLHYEGTARHAYWVGDECTDDVRFGMLRADWEAWNARQRHRPTQVELAELTPANVGAIGALATHWSQRRFVSPMARSFADIVATEHDEAVEPCVPWYRAVVADGDIAGFVMMIEPAPTHPDPYLWRLLIDRRHQRRGIGTRVLGLVTARYRERGDQALRVQYGQGRGNPSPLYRSYGFVPTGRIVDGEIEATLILERAG